MARLHEFLRGLRVVDLSRYLPGPLASLLLVDLGAEVVKVEPPGGEPMRQLGPRTADGQGAWHAALNAGKRIVELDLATGAGRDALLDLLAGADVLIESFRPGVMARLGLAFPMLRERFPRLVCVSLSGYGQDGPLAQAAGHDNNYLAQAGLLAGVGPAPEVPTLVWPPLADCLGSMFGLSALLAALLARERSGQGCHIDIALADVASPWLTLGLASLAAGEPPRRAQGLLDGGWACYGIYRTADGREVSLGAVEPKFWAAFCQAAGRPDWIARQDEPLPQQALRAEVAAFFAGLSAEDLERRFAGVDCCLARVLTLEEACASAHAQARQLVRRGQDGGLQALFPAWVDGAPPEARGAMRRGEPG
ncbi:CoA transferase [Caldimonas thermodepolymerans]|jgi:Predicted acyl-CoA transferases/carnitine dehydratase|uniref:Carnitine dehydratase n=1 Tax=Caldimonas thermodepolymerans TaxID=215580 RepID=A0A2S5T5R4_9BURK|nr:CoA transferase [Caldimonas thermodepolymerans]PPE70207.1 carnitine dehydratase [Caldimonas thermodepolymerans]QPC32202.1 CoA transferase [Caldimonas thermodepolymerans]RDH98090.1 crotonobetainyl-CoA:carnitine CoA-transferase CaiB-like acyl-CoA transferase [Caldimonas thermodepolymerans]TCP08135.1 crotonobetainyl-CoA:carnitine CoA-transferase CaiB-like acyl-CoA transferase [Caldimonas thermodepolymerans]UZG48747.1 CoA transferase [Caldimonas thermodepolymerans]